MADRPLSVVSTTDSLARVANIPLPADDGWSLREPQPPFLAAGPSLANDSPRDSYMEATPYDSGTLLPVTKNEDYTEEEDPVAPTPSSPKAKRRPLLLLLVGLVALIVVVLAVILPVYFTVIKPRNAGTSQSSSNSGNGTPTNTTGGGDTPHTPPSSTNAITGGDGSTIKASDGTTFTYNNKLGGICKFISSIIFHRGGYVEAGIVEALRIASSFTPKVERASRELFLFQYMWLGLLTQNHDSPTAVLTSPSFS
jgi:glucan 1,3-beta-glucosidase